MALQNRDIKFNISVVDEASPALQNIKSNLDSLRGASANITATGRATSTPRQPKQAEQKNTLISGEYARPLRAVGAYRTAWFAGQDMGEGKAGTAMKGAAVIFALQAIGDGIKKVVQILAEASPALRAELKVLHIAFNEILRPIGDLLASVLRPISRAMLQGSAFARKSMRDEGVDQRNLGEYYSRMFTGFMGQLQGESILGEDYQSTKDAVPYYKAALTGYAASIAPVLVMAVAISDALGTIDWDGAGDILRTLFSVDIAIVDGLVAGLEGVSAVLPSLTANLVTMDEALSPLVNTINGFNNALGGGGIARNGPGGSYSTNAPNQDVIDGFVRWLGL